MMNSEDETKNVKISLVVSPGAARLFRSLAAKYGMITTAGPRAGQGDQNRLVEAIALGEIITYRNPDWPNGST